MKEGRSTVNFRLCCRLNCFKINLRASETTLIKNILFTSIKKCKIILVMDQFIITNFENNLFIFQ